MARKQEKSSTFPKEGRKKQHRTVTQALQTLVVLLIASGTLSTLSSTIMANEMEFNGGEIMIGETGYVSKAVKFSTMAGDNFIFWHYIEGGGEYNINWYWESSGEWHKVGSVSGEFMTGFLAPSH